MLGLGSGAQDFIGVIGAVNYSGVVCRDGLTFNGELCLSSVLRGGEENSKHFLRRVLCHDALCCVVLLQLHKCCLQSTDNSQASYEHPAVSDLIPLCCAVLLLHLLLYHV
jgi:hypothetical protein